MRRELHPPFIPIVVSSISTSLAWCHFMLSDVLSLTVLSLWLDHFISFIMVLIDYYDLVINIRAEVQTNCPPLWLQNFTVTTYFWFFCLSGQDNINDVRNFDAEFTSEKPCLSPAQDPRPITDGDQVRSAPWLGIHSSVFFWWSF